MLPIDEKFQGAVMMVLREYHPVFVRIKFVSVSLMLCLITEVTDRFKENDIYWIQLLHLCLLKWNEATPEHISELETSYVLSDLQAEFQVFHAYARKNLSRKDLN